VLPSAEAQVAAVAVRHAWNPSKSSERVIRDGSVAKILGLMFAQYDASP
jgi:hypothetical protein